MNREFKFRVWYNGEFWTTDFLISPNGHICATSRWNIQDQCHTMDINTIKDKEKGILQQFTGLKDKNGKEIYEGDILASKVNEKPCNYIVKWGDNRSEYCGFVLNPVMKNPPKITYHIHDFKIWMAEGFEVIGNIFENPELLK